MIKPKVSVVVPTHNRSKMLERAIRSVLRQTWQDFELIIISDGSNDNTEDVVMSFNETRIRYLKHEISKGASAARNTGLRNAKGAYIAFLDDDDEWTLDKLEMQIAVFEKSGLEVGLIYGWMEYIENDQVVYERKPLLKGNIFSEMLDKQAITNSSTLLIRREVLDIVKGFDEDLPRGNDGDFIRRISKYFEVDYVPKVICKVYIGHRDRISVNSRNNIANAIVAFEKRLLIFEKDFSEYQKQKATVIAQIYLHYLMILKVKKSLTNFGLLLKCRCENIHKIKLIYNSSKYLIKYFIQRTWMTIK